MRAARLLWPDLLGLPLLALGLAFPSLVHGNIMSHENAAHLYPQLYFVAHKVRMGQIPSWNPYTLSGNPDLADPSGMLFYPLTVPLLLVLSVKDAINACILLHIVLAGLFMNLYLGSLAMSRPARFLGAAIYMLSGFTAGRVFGGDLPRLIVYTWIPFLCYLVEEIIHSRRGMGAALLGGFAMASQFFGDTQAFVYASLALVTYTVARLVTTHRGHPDAGRRYRAMLLFAVMFVVAGCLMAVLLLPAFELLAYSNRLGADPNFAFLGSIPPAGLASLVAPRVFGDEVHGQWGELLAPEFYVHQATLYVGFFTLVLALVALLTRRDRWHVRFFGWFGLVVLWLALGRFGYIYRAVLYIPLLRNFRDIENLNILIPLSASVLAGFGFDRYIEPGRTPKVWGQVLRILFLVISAIILIVELSLRPLQPFVHSDPLIPHALAESAAFVLFAFIISCGLLYVRARYHVAPAWVVGAVVVFVLADLLYFAFPLVNAGADVRTITQDDAVTRFLARDRSLYRIYGLGDRAVLFSAQDVGGEVGLLFARYSEYTNFVQGYDLDLVIRPAGPHGVLISRGFDSPLMALLNVKYAILGARELEASGLLGRPGVVEVGPGRFIYRNARVYPRVLDSYGYRVLDDRLAILRELNRSGYDLRRFIVLERVPDVPPDIFPSGGINWQPAEIAVMSYEDTRVTIRARFIHPGFLVLNDLYYPAWTAYLDGRPTPIYRANYLFRAVVVPAGSHEIRFVYRDRALARGAMVSGVGGVAGCLAWVVDCALQRRRSWYARQNTCR